MVPILFEGDETDMRLLLDYPRDQLVEVAVTGAGCLLVHRSVLATLGEGWFDLSLNGREFRGEDVAFCMRARSHGFPIYAHTRIKLGHIKSVGLDEDLYDAAMELGTVSTSEGRWNR